ncbi:GTPase Era [Neorickettsia findlayensis]|uniref:GTPase Era n=1 Tax=Neorickettsia findlayensis TaxID=2686014 RepID=A0A6P1GCS3_9RICK|nr:GTPase Era [Neorickettsia findlayensis]QHD65531.1 GTPase Era [Neorickettsia findlayensis]
MSSSECNSSDCPQMGENFRTRSAFVSLIGNSNVGKSTLLNAMVGSKISAVTHKVQTTRTRIRGIYTKGDVQLVFVDTPGIFIPRCQLERVIVKNAWRAFAGTDIFCLIIDPRRPVSDSTKDILRKANGKLVLVMNKIDLVEKPRLLAVAQELNSLGHFDKTFMISALKGSGIDDLMDYLLRSAQPGPWYFDEEDETDMPLEFNLSEILREKLFIRLHQELPYSLTVETENIEILDKTVKIKQVLHVMSESHKMIVIGSCGKTIGTIRKSSEREMANLFPGKKVHLSVFVRVSPNWGEKSDILNTINYI